MSCRSGLDFSPSAVLTGKLKPLNRNLFPGFLSAEQIVPHHAVHYAFLMNRNGGRLFLPTPSGLMSDNCKAVE